MISFLRDIALSNIELAQRHVLVMLETHVEHVG